MSEDSPQDIVDEPFDEDLDDDDVEETGDESDDPGYVEDVDAQDEPRGEGLPLVLMEVEEPELPPEGGDEEESD